MRPRPILVIKLDATLSQAAMVDIRNSVQDAVRDEYLVLVAEKDIDMEVSIITDDNLHFRPGCDHDWYEPCGALIWRCKKCGAIV